MTFLSSRVFARLRAKFCLSKLNSLPVILPLTMLLCAPLVLSSTPASAQSGGHWVITVTQSGLTTATESGTNYYGPYTRPFSWNWPDKDGEGDLPESLGTNDMWAVNASGSYTVLAMWLDDFGLLTADPPLKLDLLLTGNASWVAPLDNAVTSGTGADDGLGDALASYFDEDSGEIGAYSGGKHLRQYDSSSGVVAATISQSASVTAQSDIEMPYFDSVGVTHYLDAEEDNRAVTISSNFDPTYYKGQRERQSRTRQTLPERCLATPMKTHFNLAPSR